MTSLKHLLTALAAVVMVIEEWGWGPLTMMAAWIARWPPLASLEAWIRGISPRAALTLFAVPAVLLFPLKLFALWLLQKHHPWLGVGLIVGAKLLGTALVGRLFIICEEQLMTFPWFARALGWWRLTKLRIKTTLAATSGWQAIQRTRRWLRTKGRRWWRAVGR